MRKAVFILLYCFMLLGCRSLMNVPIFGGMFDEQLAKYKDAYIGMELVGINLTPNSIHTVDFDMDLCVQDHFVIEDVVKEDTYGSYPYFAVLNKEYNGDKKVALSEISVQEIIGNALKYGRLIKGYTYTGDELSSCQDTFDGKALITKMAFDNLSQLVKEDKQKAVKAKAEREQLAALCKEQQKSRDAYVKSINYICSLSEFGLLSELASSINTLNQLFGEPNLPTPNLKLNGRYEISGTIVDVLSNGVIVKIANSGFIVFVYTSDDYYDGKWFSDTFLYEYTGNRSFKTVSGGKRTVPAFRKTRHSINDIPELDPQCRKVL